MVCVYSLDDEGLGVKDEGSQQLGRDGVVFGFGLEDQTFISWKLRVLHLLHRPFTCTSHTHTHTR